MGLRGSRKTNEPQHKQDIPMTKDRLTSVGARRRGDDYQDIQAIKLMIDWLGYKEQFQWIKVEADEAGYLDDVMVLRSDERINVIQVKFSNHPENDDQILTWKDLLKREKKRGTSLLQKWSKTLEDLQQSGYMLAETYLITNWRPAPELFNVLNDEGIVDFDAIRAVKTKNAIITQIGDKQRAEAFFKQFRFYLKRPNLEEAEDAIKRTFINDLRGSQHGWSKLKEQVRSWVIYKDRPNLDGFIYLKDIVDAAFEPLLEEQTQAVFNENSLILNSTNVPSKSDHYVERKKDIVALKTLILDEGLSKISLRGIGGIGKSTLAEELARDPEVYSKFKRIYFVTAGQKAEVYSVQMALVDALGDKASNYSSDVNRNQIRLRSYLSSEPCLIILDDVWDAELLDKLDVLGPNGCLIITTRNDLGLGIPVVILQPMSIEESIELLEKWVGQKDTSFKQIAEQLGCLPLALRIAGARMKRGLSGTEWLAKFSRVSRMKMHRNADSASDNVQMCFELSIDFAFRDQRENKYLYYALGIFSQDAHIPKPAIIRLWQQISEVPEFDLFEYFDELVRLTLIELDVISSTASMHDLLQSHAEESLGTDAARTHTALLESYNPENKDWWNINHDGYIYTHLLQHMKAANYQIDTIYKLLVGSPEWMSANYIACQGDGAYLADLQQLAFDMKNPLSPSDILRMAQLTAARHVVLQRSNKYEDMDLQILVWLEREKEAIEYADMRGDLSERLAGQLSIFHSLFLRSPNSNYLEDILENVLRVLESGHDGIHGGIYASTAIALIRLNRLQAASTIALNYEGEESSWRKSELIAHVASNFALEGADDFAKQLLGHIEHDWDKDRSQHLISRSLAEKDEDISEIFEIIEEITRIEFKLRAYADVAELKYKMGKNDQANKAVEHAKTLIETSTSPRNLVRELAYLARKLSQFTEAQENAKHFISLTEDLQSELEGSIWISEALSDVAVAYSHLFQMEKIHSTLTSALFYVSKIEVRDDKQYKDFDERYRVDAIKAIVWRCIDLKEIVYAKNLLKEIRFTEDRIEMLCEIAFQVNETASETAKDLLNEALKLCELLEHPYSTRRSLRYVSLTNARLGYKQTASDILSKASQINDENDNSKSEYDYIRSDALSNISYALSKHGELETAHELTQLAINPFLKVDVLYSMAMNSRDLAFSQTVLSEMTFILNKAENNETREHMQEKILHLRMKLGLEKASPQYLVSEAYHLMRLSNIVEAKELIDPLEPSVEKAIFLCRYIHEAKDLSDDQIQQSLNEIYALATAIQHEIQSYQQIVNLIEATSQVDIILDNLNLLQQALSLGSNIEKLQDRSNALERIARTSITVNQPEIAKEIVESSGDLLVESLVSILCQLAVYYLHQNDINQYQYLLEEAKRRIDGLENNHSESKGKSLQKYCWALSKGQQLHEALDLARNIAQQNSRDEALRSIAYSFSETQEFEQVLSLAEEIHSEHERAWAFQLVARKYFEQGKLNESLSIMQRKESNEHWIHHVIGFADQLLNSGYKNEAALLFDHALALIRSMGNSNRRGSAGDYLLSIFVKHKLYTEFFNTLRGQVVDVYIQIIARHADAFDMEGKALSVSILKETTRIASWIQPFWREVSNLLGSTAST